VNHRITIHEQGEGGVQAVCSCGWRSPGIRHRQDGRHDGPTAARSRGWRSAPVGDVPAISSATCPPPRHRTRIRARPGAARQPTGTAVHTDLRAYGHPLTATLRDSLATFTSTCRDRPDRGRQVSQMPTRIAFSYLMLWPQRSRPQARLPGDARSHGDGGLQPAGQVLSPIGACHREVLRDRLLPQLADRLPAGYSQAGLGAATQCEYSRGSLALADTPNAD
jgi:hypothetical protein